MYDAIFENLPLAQVKGHLPYECTLADAVEADDRDEALLLQALDDLAHLLEAANHGDVRFSVLEELLVGAIVVAVQLKFAFDKRADRFAGAVVVVLQDALVELVLGFTVFYVVGSVFWTNYDELVRFAGDRRVRVILYELLRLVESITDGELVAKEVLIKSFGKLFLSDVFDRRLTSCTNDVANTGFVECPTSLLRMAGCHKNKLNVRLFVQDLS